MVSRYHKSEIYSKKEKKNVSADVFIEDIWNARYVKAIYHSKRMKEDKIKSNKINKLIDENKRKLSEFTKK